VLPPAWKTTPSGKVRARGLGLPLSGRPGPGNCITDLGVEVGYATLHQSDSVRTGVTAILPRGLALAEAPCAAGSFSFNGSGEMTGLLWIEESGELQTPITITNTHSLGIARDATIEWMVKRGIGMGQDWGLPVAAETYDGELNDINGFHVRSEHVMAALDCARAGPIELGSVGGGTGMICYDFKGGSGSASRKVRTSGGDYLVGSFVQSNFGLRPELTILGVPVGREMPGGEVRGRPGGSIIAIVATDAPLLPHQLKRLSRRVPVGLARTGAIGHNSSGDIFLSFSTANEAAFRSNAGVRSMQFLPNAELDDLFEAVIESVEEAVIDSMIANDAMTGRGGCTVQALPHARLLELLSRTGLKFAEV
jgi:L-aminopeptidase/D-esterase-like protein